MEQTIKRTLLILSVILMLIIMPPALFASGSKFEQSTHKTAIGVIAMDPSKTRDYKTVA